MRCSQEKYYPRAPGRMGVKSIWQEFDERTNRGKKKIEGNISKDYQTTSSSSGTSSSALDVNQDS